MRENSVEITVEWGHCDAADIVFYPNYLRWFDKGLHALLRSVGLSQRKVREEYGIVGTVAGSVQVSFVGPATYDDRLTITSRIAEWGTSSFTVAHEIASQNGPVAKGQEVRIWAGPHPEDAGRLKAKPIPDDFKRLFD